MKTVLGDELICWEDFRGNQLLRCPKQKKKEAQYLLQMPKDTGFIDVGSHYGDTVLTMAAYAKSHNRPDIKFYACEPNPLKCAYIHKIAHLNNLDVTVWNMAVGDTIGFCKPDGTRQESNGACSFKQDPKGKTVMCSLDMLKPMLGNIGFMHLDVEGWEAKVIRGAKELIQNTKNNIYMIAECWSSKVSLERGFSATPEDDIIEALNVAIGGEGGLGFTDLGESVALSRLPDLCDRERNLVFQINMDFK